MMANLMGDYIGLGKIASSLEALSHFLEETHIQIDLLVGRAIKRPAGSCCKAAGRIDLATKQHQGRVFIATPGLLKHLAPGVFGVAQYRPHKIGLLVIGCRCATSGLGNLGGRLIGELAA